MSQLDVENLKKSLLIAISCETASYWINNSYDWVIMPGWIVLDVNQEQFNIKRAAWKQICSREGRFHVDKYKTSQLLDIIRNSS